MTGRQPPAEDGQGPSPRPGPGATPERSPGETPSPRPLGDIRRVLARPNAHDLLAILPIVAGLVAEGAWIGVPAAFMQAMSRHGVILGPLQLAAIAFVGYLAARRLGSSLGPSRWPLLSALLVAVVAMLGWLVDPGVRSAMLAGDVAAAIARHPAGWLAGLAFMRGIAHAGPSATIGIASSLVTVLVIVVAFFLVVGRLLPDAQRAAFNSDGLIAVTVFVAASTVAVALGRIVQIAESTGFDWRPNRAWIGLLAVLVVAIVTIAVPASLAVDTPIRLALQLLPAPLLVLGFFIGLRGAWKATLTAMGVMSLIVIVLVVVSQFGQRYDPVVQPPQSFQGSDQANDVPLPAIVAWALALVALIGLVALLARYWMREALRDDVGGVREERSIDVSSIVQPRRRGFRRRRDEPSPGTAVQAYLALIADIEGRAAVERHPTETSAEHAHRLRQTGVGATGLDLLAADFELERFGAVALSAPENRRGVARWRRLRHRLGRGSS